MWSEGQGIRKKRKGKDISRPVQIIHQNRKREGNES